MEGKTLRKGRFQDENGKRHEKCQQPVRGSDHDYGEELGDDAAPDCTRAEDRYG